MAWRKTGEDRLCQRLRDAQVAVIVVVKPVDGNEFGERLALPTPVLHQRAPREQRGAGIGGDLRKVLVEQRLLRLRQQAR